jgi:acyl carrier protein
VRASAQAARSKRGDGPRIIELVAKSKNLPASDVKMDTTFDELQIDSLDKINLSFAVEEMFSIEIPDDSLNSLKTVGDVVRGVENLLGVPPDAAKA